MAPFSRISSNWENGARISVEEPGVASCRLLRDNDMASVSQFNPYHCDQCGTANIVAAPVLFEQGTRTYSGTFYSGMSQSFSAQSVAPPYTRGYIRPFLLWGPLVIIFWVWTVLGAGSILDHPVSSVLRPNTLAVFLLLGLRWNWEHTYICRRCGKPRLIPS
jgi:hypothetical protein